MSCVKCTTIFVDIVLVLSYRKTADIWSLGMLVIEMGNGRPPWTERKFDNPIALMMALSVGGLPGLPPHLTPEARQFVEKTLARDANVRPSASQCLSSDWLWPLKEGTAEGAKPVLITSPAELDWASVKQFCFN